MKDILFWYTLISIVLTVVSIAVMVGEDRESSECYRVPTYGYNFRKDDTGEFYIRKRTWIAILALAPFTNLIFAPFVMWIVLRSSK